jgi:flagellar biosynthetic protein FliP
MKTASRFGPTVCLLLCCLSVFLLLLAPAAQAQQAGQAGLDLLTVTGGSEGDQTYTVSLQVLMFMTALSVLPALLITTTAFTRIIIVLAILRQGLGTQQTPNNQVLLGIALFLTAFIMAPVGDRVYREAITPYLEQGMAAGDAVGAATAPVREFMLAHTRETDLAMFAGLGGYDQFNDAQEVPLTLLLPAFVTSELKTAFQIGFLLLIPFLIIDLVVASVLMSMGMVMLSPLIISLPFKIMLFVLVDGWSLVMTTLAGSFFI